MDKHQWIRINGYRCTCTFLLWKYLWSIINVYKLFKMEKWLETHFQLVHVSIIDNRMIEQSIPLPNHKINDFRRTFNLAHPPNYTMYYKWCVCLSLCQLSNQNYYCNNGENDVPQAWGDSIRKLFKLQYEKEENKTTYTNITKQHHAIKVFSLLSLLGVVVFVFGFALFVSWNEPSERGECKKCTIYTEQPPV